MFRQYRWLGDLNGINALELFGININDYFNNENITKPEVEKLKRDLKQGYHGLILNLHDDRLKCFPESFKQLSRELFEEVSHLYDLFTNEQKYNNPDPDAQHHNLPGIVTVTIETFTLTNYVLSLKCNQPNSYYHTHIIKSTIEARNELEKLLTTQPIIETDQPPASSIILPPRNPLPIAEYIQVIEDQDRAIAKKEKEIAKLNADITRIESISKGYRDLLQQGSEERLEMDAQLTEMNKRLEEMLKS